MLSHQMVQLRPRPTMVAPTSSTSRPAAAPTVRRLGRFELRQLLGKSSATMVWLAYDPRLDQELMLTLPRVQPALAALGPFARASPR